MILAKLGYHANLRLSEEAAPTNREALREISTTALFSVTRIEIRCMAY